MLGTILGARSTLSASGLTENSLGQAWLANFHNGRDRALASQLLRQLRLVSGRDFEVGLTRKLLQLQKTCKSTLAVYPVIDPFPEGIAGYDPFSGALPIDPADSLNPEVGRRRKYGSEDRVGHYLTRLQAGLSGSRGASQIECNPSLKQLKTQKIKHIVFVDDMIGSGARIEKFLKIVPKTIKSLLSLGKIDLWIIVFAVSEGGLIKLQKILPRFPFASNLITIINPIEISKVMSQDLIGLCDNYANLYFKKGQFGFSSNIMPIIFEHGCPNNAPIILWGKHARWSGIFPHRLVPVELRSSFDKDSSEREFEKLWRSRQHRLALALVNALDRETPISSDQSLLLTILGLMLKGIKESDLSARLMCDQGRCDDAIALAIRMNFVDPYKRSVSPLGRDFVGRFKRRFINNQRAGPLGSPLETYYPGQCGGVLRGW